MKALLPFALLVAAPLLNSESARADGRPFPFDELGEKSVSLHTQNSSPDDYVIAMARAADVNVLVDVTETPAAAPKLAMNQRHNMRWLLYDFITRRNLRCVRFEDRTLLMWPAPDLATIAHSIVAQESGDVKDAPAATWTVEEANTQLQKYFEDAHGWNGQWENVDLRVAVDALPPDLQSRVRDEVQRRVALQNGGGEQRSLFDDEVWQKHARLEVRSSGRPGTPFIPLVVLKVPVAEPGAQGHLVIPVGQLGTARR